MSGSRDASRDVWDVSWDASRYVVPKFRYVVPKSRYVVPEFRDVVPSAPNKRVFVVGAEPVFRGVLTRLFGQALVEPQSCYSP